MINPELNTVISSDIMQEIYGSSENMENKENIIKEIREKIKNNPKYVHPCNKEFREDIKRYGFDTGSKYIYWMQQNGVLANPGEIRRKDNEEFYKRHNFKNRKEYLDDLYKIDEPIKNTKIIKCSFGYYKELAKKDGFEGSNALIDWNKWRIETGKLNITRIDKEYQDNIYQNLGYKNRVEYKREWSYNNGTRLPISENPDCPLYVGILIGEEIAKPILIEIFGGIEKEMHLQNPGFDKIVYGNFNVDIKTALLQQTSSGSIGWGFPIRHNRTADYFLLLAIDDLENRNILHVLLIHKNDMIMKSGFGLTRFYKREKMWITNKQRYLLRLEKYDWINRLKCLKDIQKELKDMEM